MGSLMHEEDAALSRVLGYFERAEIGNLEQRARIALRVIETGRRMRTIRSQTVPTNTAMNILFSEMDRWFAGTGGGTDARTIPEGLVSLRLAATLPESFPFGEQRPEDLVQAPPPSTPPLMVSNMTSEEIDYGGMEVVAHETWHQFAWGPVIRAAGLWTGIFFGTLYLWIWISGS